MRPYTPHSPQLLSVRSNAPLAVSTRGDTDETGEFSARTRIGTRGGVRVAFGTVSTTEHRSPNAEARGRSWGKVLVDHLAAAICNRLLPC